MLKLYIKVVDMTVDLNLQNGIFHFDWFEDVVLFEDVLLFGDVVLFEDAVLFVDVVLFRRCSTFQKYSTFKYREPFISFNWIKIATMEGTCD